MVAMREIRERIRGRIFRIGTLILLVAVAAAIVIPTLHNSQVRLPRRWASSAACRRKPRQLVRTAGARTRTRSPSCASAPWATQRPICARATSTSSSSTATRSCSINRPTSNNSPADPALVQDVAEYLGVLVPTSAAGLSPEQAAQVDHAKSAPVHTLQPSSKGTTKATSVIGLVLLFFILTQYNTWILIGVMQEKSSRVVEVLLATVRPLQLLGGKVLGIGLVALGQATLVVGFALDRGRGGGFRPAARRCPPGPCVPAALAGPGVRLLLLGVRRGRLDGRAPGPSADAGTAPQHPDPRRATSSRSPWPAQATPDLFFKILAYLPPTAPFCMPVLVGLNQVTWWEFVASVLISIAGTVGMAIFAARIYRRAVLRTGGRVSLRQLLART